MQWYSAGPRYFDEAFKTRFPHDERVVFVNVYSAMQPHRACPVKRVTIGKVGFARGHSAVKGCIVPA
jgi:hypothetical protein